LKNDRSELRLLAPMTFVVVIAVCALISSLWVWSEQTDALSRKKEEQLVLAGINTMAEQNAKLMTPMTIWDEGVINTAIAYQESWVITNFGKYFQNHMNYERSFVLDQNNQTVFAWDSGQTTDLKHYKRFEPSANLIVGDLRTQYYNNLVSGAVNSGNSNYNGRLMAIDGRLYILGGSLVLPDTKRDFVTQVVPFVVISVHEVTGAELRQFSQQYRINDIQILEAGKRVPDGFARIGFQDQLQRTQAQLVWAVDRPGRELFFKAIGPLLLVSMGFGAIAIRLLLQSQKIARNLIASEARAKHMAMHDALTGLPNRSLFADRLTQATERLRRQPGQVAVFCVGLDRFKDVNDTLGHVAGDELIRHSASQISGLIRSCDTLARLGGDEFVIIQSDTDGLGAAALAKRILEGLSGTVTLESGQVFSSCSIGVTILHDADIEPAEALRQADLSLYRAKENGRGQYTFFEPEMDATIKLRKFLEAGLREAVRLETIDIVYQPQVDHFGHIVGVEALARWSHPERGPISPAYFIPLAEECGLMTDLGSLIMRRAMVDSKRWPGLKVAINVSASQMRTGKFISSVKALLDETKVDATNIEIEITEGVLLNDDQQTQMVLRDLRAMGFSIALDDFGTGYSSLSYLSRYPVDKIKIDRSFVSNLGADPEAETVIRAIVKLAKALNLNIVAEGVETKSQRSILRQAGCPIIQGYLFSKPVALNDIDVFMHSQVTHMGQSHSMVANK
jgi:diguanylate cyclase (GGDEF)-like protein